MSAPTISLAGLDAALVELEPWLARARAGARGGTNAEGGDPASHASPTLLTRHLGHYLAAAEVAGKGVDRLVDVGCGTGAYTGWLGERTGAAITVVDHDPTVLAVAAEVSGATTTARDLAQVEPATLVTAMEVLEHIAPGDQPGFCAALLGTVAPGGHLVLSTPDESLYPGGWSGYAPHIGCVTAGELAAMLVETGAATATVFRIVGGPYVTPASRRWVEAIGNRAWTWAQGVAPTLAERLAAAGSHEDEGAVEVDPIAVGVPHVRVVPAEHGRGGSLVAVATV